MFGFSANLLILLEKSKLKALKKRKESSPRLIRFISTKIDASREDADADGLQKKISVSKLKIISLELLSSFITFFEMLPVFFFFLYSILLLICIIGAVIVTIMLTTMLNGLFHDPVVKFTAPEPDPTVQSDGGNAQWSEIELASRGAMLSDCEKNLYRLVLLSKKAVEGYGGPTLLTKYGTSKETAMTMLVGISSTETSMLFYEGNKNYNILETPSDLKANKQGYGFLGISSTKAVSDYYNSTITSNIKTAYTPKTTPSYDATFAPWGLAMSARHMYNDASSVISSSATEAKMDAAMDTFGIQANRDSLKELLAWYLAQAQYQGAVTSEYADYLNFWCALYALTSDTDADRTMSKWVLVSDNYSESTMRALVLGTTNHRSIVNYSNPANLPTANTGSSYLTLNGVKINKPLWALIYDKYGSKPEIVDAWKRALVFAGSGSSIADRVLNFHYGFNSNLQGRNIMRDISGKLTGGSFTETPGIGQGNWGGKSIADYASGSTSAMRFKQYWGTATFTTVQKINGVDWKPDKFGAPFYQQGGSAEAYGNITWNTRSTFNYSGCMIYAYAYTASALTSRLINPPEMASAMYVNGALVDAGVVPINMPKVYSALGLNCEIVPLSSGEGDRPAGQIFDKVWSRVDETLDKGGLVVVRGSSPWSSSSNHFFVITSKSVEGSKTIYSMYSSTHVDQTMTTFEKSAYEGTLQSEVYLITK